MVIEETGHGTTSQEGSDIKVDVDSQGDVEYRADDVGGSVDDSANEIGSGVDHAIEKIGSGVDESLNNGNVGSKWVEDTTQETGLEEGRLRAAHTWGRIPSVDLVEWRGQRPGLEDRCGQSTRGEGQKWQKSKVAKHVESENRYGV